MRARLHIPGLRWLGLTAAFYLLFLLVRLPAGAALERLASPLPADLHFAHVSGTLWSGTLHNARLPQVALGEVRWRIRPGALFLGRLAADVTIDDGNSRLRGRLGIGPSGAFHISTLTGTVELRRFDDLVRPLMLSGHFRFDGLDAELSPDQTLHLAGEGAWENATIGGVQDLGLGTIRWQANPDATGSLIRFHNEKGDLAITGQVTLAADGSWNLEARLRNRDPSRRELQQLLRFLGRPDAEGNYRFRQQGRLALR